MGKIESIYEFQTTNSSTENEKSTNLIAVSFPVSTNKITTNLQPTRNTPEFKVVSFNIDTNLARLEGGYAFHSFPEWKIASRMHYIKEY